MEIGLIYYLLVFAAGTFVGSFLNLVSDRIINGEPILIGRSHCDYCKKPLSAINLVPVISYIKQKGKCSYCKTSLSMLYPVSEILTGLSFILAAYLSQVLTGSPSVYNYIYFLFLIFTFSVYVILFLTDAKYRLIPDKIIFPAIFTVLAGVILLRLLNIKIFYDYLNEQTLGKYFLQAGVLNTTILSEAKVFLLTIGTAFAISLFFMFLIFITKGRGMGGGDVKLGFLIGLFNGFPFNVIAVFLGFVYGAVYSLVLMAFKRKGLKDTIAFGPFLIAGSITSLLWGVELLNWYLGLF